MESQTQDRLIPRLLDQSIEYHTRKGMRDWCDCAYCKAKRAGTQRLFRAGTMIHYGCAYSPVDDWQLWAAINGYRTSLKNELREELNELKATL